MALKVIWTETAANDFRAIVQYIALYSPEAARRLAERILARIEAAATLPFSCRSVPEKQDPVVREALLKPYRIIYTVDESREVIYIVRIWHAARGTPVLLSS